MIGQILGNYKILEQAGEGNMGAVYHALDLMLDREVALKALRPELARRADVVERFREEARVQARLNHRNVAQMYTLFRHGEDLFMVMEFVQGPTLDTIIRDAGRMSLQQALPIFLQVLDGVEHAHSMGIIHRDLKPANIMLNRDGLIKVTDFGIARVLGSARMTREGAMIGTLEYMPPERVLGKELDARSDLYSLGFVFYEMLTGNLPFTSQTEYEILKAQIEAPPPPIRTTVPEIPAQIEAAILTAMAKNPDDRYPSAASFAAALRGSDSVAVTGQVPEIPARTLPIPPPAPSVARGSAGETRFTDAYTPDAPSPVPSDQNQTGMAQLPAPKTNLLYYVCGLALLVLIAVVWAVVATSSPKPKAMAPVAAPTATQPVAAPPQVAPLPAQPEIPPTQNPVENASKVQSRHAPTKSQRKSPASTKENSEEDERRKIEESLGIKRKPENQP